MEISPERDELWQRLPAARVPLQLSPGALPLVQRKGRDSGQHERGIPGDGASCAPRVPHGSFPCKGSEQPLTLLRPAGAAGGTRDLLQGQGTPHHPIHGQPMGGVNCKPRRGPGLGPTRASTRPPGQGEAAAIPREGKNPRKGQTPHPPGSPRPGQRGCGPRSGQALPARLGRPSRARAPPSHARAGAGPSVPAIPPSPPHSPRGAATSPCRAGVGAAPAREGGRGREGAAAAPSVPLHVPGAGQPRKRGRGGGGGHGATSHPAAEVAGARARAWRERARAAREEPVPLAGKYGAIRK